MAEVDVTIGGRSYRLACDDGQEAHLKSLAARIDAEAKGFGAAAGQIPEPRLLLMSALMIADKLDELEAKASAPPPAPAPQASLFSDADVQDAAEAVEAATNRIRGLAAPRTEDDAAPDALSDADDDAAAQAAKSKFELRAERRAQRQAARQAQTPPQQD